MEEMKFEVKDEMLVIYLPKELDHHTADYIRKKTDSLFFGKRIRDVIFDYSHTYFMDSSGIGLVMGRYREVRYLNGDVYIVGVNERIERFLDISGLYRVVKRCDTVKDAMNQIEINRKVKEEENGQV